MIQLSIVSRRARELRGLWEALLDEPVEVHFHPDTYSALLRCVSERPDWFVLDLSSVPADAASVGAALRLLEPRPVSVLQFEAKDHYLQRQAAAARWDLMLLEPIDWSASRQLLQALRKERLPWRGPDYHAYVRPLAAGVADRIGNALTALRLQNLQLGELLGRIAPTELGLCERIESEILRSDVVIAALQNYSDQHRTGRSSRRLEFGPLMKEIAANLAARGKTLVPADLQILDAYVTAEPGPFKTALQALVEWCRAEVAPPANQVTVVARKVSGWLEVEIRGSRKFDLPSPPHQVFLPFHPLLRDQTDGGLAIASAYGLLHSLGAQVDTGVDGYSNLWVRLRLPSSLPEP